MSAERAEDGMGIAGAFGLDAENARLHQALADAQRRIAELEQELERERAKHR